MTQGARWYVVHTQPNGETRADLNLRRQGEPSFAAQRDPVEAPADKIAVGVHRPSGGAANLSTHCRF